MDGYVLGEEAYRQLQAMFAAFRAEIEPYLVERGEFVGRQAANWELGIAPQAIALDKQGQVQICIASAPTLPGGNVQVTGTGRYVDALNVYGNIPANAIVGIVRKYYGWVITEARCS
jgi:hypothetical protein